MRTFSFRSSAIKGQKEVDIAKVQLFVPAGSDLFEDIGLPKTTRRQDFSKEQHEERAKQWKKIVSEYYTPTGEVKETSNEEELEETAKAAAEYEKFPNEPNIDRVRQRKR